MVQLSVLRLKAVRQRTGLAASTIYKAIREGSFPNPIRLGDRAVGWLETDINGWIERRVKSSKAMGA